MQLNTFFKNRRTTNCIQLSSKITKRELPFSTFSRLEVSNDFRVYIQFSQTKEQLKVEANSNLQDYINVSFEGDLLTISKKAPLPLKGKEVSNIYITTQPFSNFRVSDDSYVAVNSIISTSEATIELSNDSSFTGMVDVDKLSLVLKGDSVADMEGVATDLELKLSGDSKLENYQLQTDRLEAKISGDSSVKVTVNDTVNLKAKGGGILYFKGNASVKPNKSPSSSYIRK